MSAPGHRVLVDASDNVHFPWKATCLDCPKNPDGSDPWEVFEHRSQAYTYRHDHLVTTRGYSQREVANRLAFAAILRQAAAL